MPLSIRKYQEQVTGLIEACRESNLEEFQSPVQDVASQVQNLYEEIDGQYFLSIDMERKQVAVSGIDQPKATIVKLEGDILTIKVPGHSYWVGLDMPKGYAKAVYQVYSILDVKRETDTLTTCRAIRLTEFPTR